MDRNQSIFILPEDSQDLIIFFEDSYAYYTFEIKLGESLENIDFERARIDQNFPRLKQDQVSEFNQIKTTELFQITPSDIKREDNKFWLLLI